MLLGIEILLECLFSHTNKWILNEMWLKFFFFGIYHLCNTVFIVFQLLNSWYLALLHLFLFLGQFADNGNVVYSGDVHLISHQHVSAFLLTVTVWIAFVIVGVFTSIWSQWISLWLLTIVLIVTLVITGAVIIRLHIHISTGCLGLLDFLLFLAYQS